MSTRHAHTQYAVSYLMCVVPAVVPPSKGSSAVLPRWGPIPGSAGAAEGSSSGSDARGWGWPKVRAGAGGQSTWRAPRLEPGPACFLCQSLKNYPCSLSPCTPVPPEPLARCRALAPAGRQRDEHGREYIDAELAQAGPTQARGLHHRQPSLWGCSAGALSSVPPVGRAPTRGLGPVPPAGRHPLT